MFARRSFTTLGSTRKLMLLTLMGVLPLGAALSQGLVTAQASVPASVSGTWAMLQVSKTSALTGFRSAIDAALAMPGVTGLSLRAPWTSITSNLDIFEDGLQIAQADHSALAIRFVSGVDTPSQFLGNSTKIGSQAIPLPWGLGSTATSFVPNTTFENAYSATVHQLAAYALANNIHVLHLPWYSGTTAEIYNGPEVQAAPGYSLQNFLTGYERLVAIGMQVASPDLTVEFPLGGVGTGSVVVPLESYMSTTYGSDNPELMVQFNDLTDASPPILHPSAGVNMERQMAGQGDYDWATVYATLVSQHSQSVEVYLQSFASSFPHASLLRQEVASFAAPLSTTISSVTPSTGPATGGQAVTVSGSAFAAGMSVTVGTTQVTPTQVTATSFDIVTPPEAPGLVQIQVQVTPPGGGQMTAAAGYTFVALSNYVPVTPFRILDTRSASCIQCAGLALGPDATRTVPLVGVTGLRGETNAIPSTATAVVLNVTAVGSSAGSLLAVYPTGTKQPRVSSLNFGAHATVPNLVTATLGQGGAVNIYNALGTVNVIADVEGYFAPQASTVATGEFHPITPVRVCDTRSDCQSHGALQAGQSIVVNATAAGGIPDTGTAEAAVLNLTGIAGSASTYLSVFPTTSSGTCAYSGNTAPPFSTLNLTAGSVEANRVMVQLGPGTPEGPDNSFCVYNDAGAINVAVDVNGWFGNVDAVTGSQYQAIGPTRICDTRAGSGLPCAGHTLGAGGVDLVEVAGLAGVPIGSPLVQAVVANLTVIAPSAGTYLVLYPANLSTHPVASDINVNAGAVLPNLAVVSLDTSGDVSVGDMDLYNSQGSVNVVIDVEGWFQ